MDKLKEISETWPLAVGIGILFLAFLGRINDIFVLHLDELWGELLLSKSFGLGLVIVYVVIVKDSLREIGFHTDEWALNLLLGMTLFVGVYFFAYGLEYMLLTLLAKEPNLIIKVITSKPGVGFWFIIWIILGNLITAGVEESLFRGLLTSKLRTSFSFWTANFFQALLFGLWHLVWPIKRLMGGQVGGQTAAFTGSMLLLVAVVNGFVWGYMYLKTNSLWACWMANVAASTILNLVHIESQFGLDGLQAVRGTGIMLGAIVSMLAIKYIAEEFKLEEAAAW